MTDRIVSLVHEAERLLMTLQPKDVFDFVVAACAVVAIVVSIVSLRYSKKSLRISEAQELRRIPQLAADLVQSYSEVAKGVRTYSFLLTVRNPTDTDNAISALELRLSYSLPSGVEAVIKLPPSPLCAPEKDGLSVPCKVVAHDAVSGWCRFLIEPDLLKDGVINGYEVVLTDTHKSVTVVSPIVVVGKRHEA